LAELIRLHDFHRRMFTGTWQSQSALLSAPDWETDRRHRVIDALFKLPALAINQAPPEIALG